MTLTHPLGQDLEIGTMLEEFRVRYVILQMLYVYNMFRTEVIFLPVDNFIFIFSRSALLVVCLGGAIAAAQKEDDFSCPDEFEGFYPHLIR
jgi:hypothetical protein